MELLVLLVIVFFIGKAFGKRKNTNNYEYEYEYEYQPRKKKGCSSLLVVVFIFVIIVLFSSSSSPSGTEPSPTSAPAVEQTAPTAKPTAEPTAEPTIKPTAEPTSIPVEEPTTLQGWAEVVAQEIYGSFDYKYTRLLSVECEQVDGDPAPMITICVQYPDTFFGNNDERMSNFLYNVMRTTWKLNDLAKEGKIEYGSVFIRGRSMFADKYGNEFEADAAQIRIKASEAAKVNWSLTSITGDMMPGIAVSFGMQPVIREGLSSSYYNSIKK